MLPTTPCARCGQPATTRFTNRPNLPGIPSCEACASEVEMATQLLCSPNDTSRFTGIATLNRWQRQQQPAQ